MGSNMHADTHAACLFLTRPHTHTHTLTPKHTTVELDKFESI